MERRKAEAMLEGYYRQWTARERLLAAKAGLEAQLAAVRQLVAETWEMLPGFGLVLVYGELWVGRNYSPGDPTGTAAVLHAQTLAALEGEITDLLRRKVKVEMRLATLAAGLAWGEAILACLPAADRAMLERKYLHRQSNVEIAAVLDLDESSIRYRLGVSIDRIAAALS